MRRGSARSDSRSRPATRLHTLTPAGTYHAAEYHATRKRHGLARTRGGLNPEWQSAQRTPLGANPVCKIGVRQTARMRTHVYNPPIENYKWVAVKPVRPQ